MQFVFPTKNLKRYRFPTHMNDLVMDRSEAVTSEVFVTVIEPGKAPPLHKHDDTEQIFYVIEGTGVLTIGQETKETYPVSSGDVVRIPPSTWHSIEATSDTDLKYVSIDAFLGGRPKEEPTWDSHVKVICKLNGWDFDEIMKNSKE